MTRNERLGYEVLWDPRVPEGLREIAEPERRRVVSRILSLADDPIPAAARALPRPPGAYSLDEGRFSLRYIVNEQARTVAVYAVLKDGELLNAEAYRVDA